MADLVPPSAKRIPHKVVAPHGHTRDDPYYWLRNRDNPAVISYLQEENLYTSHMLRETEDLQKDLFDEIVGRIVQDDSSVPYREKNYEYYRRYRKGDSYPLSCRRRVGTNKEEIMFDIPSMAKGHKFYRHRTGELSSNEEIVAFSTDTRGRRIYTLRFKNLVTGKILPEKLEHVTGNHAWANDNKTIFYTRQDPETLRSYQVYKHVLGSPVQNDVLVFEEKDETFRCYVYKTKSGRFIVIGSSQTLSDEFLLIEADRPDDKPKIFSPRRRNLEYSIDHVDDRFLIRTNKEAPNFRLMSTPLEHTAEKNWEEVIPSRDDVYLSSVEVFRDYLVVTERRNALNRIRIRNAEGQWHEVDFEEPAYSASLGVNVEMNTETLRFSFESMRIPDSTFDYNMRTRQKSLLKQQKVLGGFDSGNYRTERLDATAKDGTKIPISLVYHKSIKRDGTAPLYLYGYGSYGSSMSAGFRSTMLSLINRGFVYAIAHVRGGQEHGRRWYEDGKLMKKKNTFTDFIDCAEHLAKEQYADPDRLFAGGGSAGGLLIGAVANMRPDLFRGLIADVPFVDVVTTMLDDTIPLTTFEYDEWGNPSEEEAYHYMLSYSPYDNVTNVDYPALLILAGLHDSQVQYWEPAKWAARLRHRSTGNNLLLLKTDMTAGHGGASGRFDRFRDIALEHAFLLKLSGLK
ncbi:MAG: oligopeptidase B [Roseibacillus sp.]|nr:oligopeptidase B [Roseibacillus sp.]MBQ64305.1 oligopeptidase B [Euryarchaeota archaeon]